jgi:hypothetical protein
MRFILCTVMLISSAFWGRISRVVMDYASREGEENCADNMDSIQPPECRIALQHECRLSMHMTP